MSDVIILTERQRTCLELLAEGLYIREISEKLFLSDNTIKTHLKVVARRLGSRNSVHMVSLAYRRGLLPIPGGQS